MGEDRAPDPAQEREWIRQSNLIYGGLIAFALPDAPKVWEFFGDFAAESPDELVLMMALVHAPDGSGHKIAAVAMCHCGDLAKG